MRIALLAAIITALWTSAASAQRITVQQPVVQTFSVDTIVSVPDRGRMFLGGTSSARSSWSHYGPGTFGSTFGRGLDRSTADVGVFIHDFEAMDAALLNQAARNSPQASRPATRAQAAWQQLQSRKPTAVSQVR